MVTNDNVRPVNKQRDKNGRFLSGNGYGFKPGICANPSGRPKLPDSLTSRLREKLKDPCPYSPAGVTWLEYLADRWLAQATENPGYFKELMDRLEGKVTQPIGGPNGGAIPVRVVEIVKDYGNSDKH